MDNNSLFTYFSCQCRKVKLCFVASERFWKGTGNARGSTPGGQSICVRHMMYSSCCYERLPCDLPRTFSQNNVWKHASGATAWERGELPSLPEPRVTGVSWVSRALIVAGPHGDKQPPALTTALLQAASRACFPDPTRARRTCKLHTEQNGARVGMGPATFSRRDVQV